SIYSCSDWEFDDKECESDWVSLNMSQQFLYSTYLSAKVDSTEAFGLGEFREAPPPPPPPPPPLVEFNWSEIKPGRVALVDITHPDIDFTKLFFRVNRKVINVRLSMRKLSSKPSGTPSMSGKSYKYFDINPVNIQDADLSEARINFKVRKSWINDNDIDEANIYLYRYYNNEWKRLETTKINEDSSYVYYRANIPGFSFFAITGRATSPVCDNDDICDSGENADNCPNDCQCNSGETRDCAVANLGICSVGGETCSNGRWTGCPSPQTEACNRRDDDCDGTVDDVNNGNSIASTGCQ
ncbi:MAG: PGF-pre-PGF domain-containing protein, partial [Candidatus Aenigmarchaeota archaeon]|nr:PGF-pre-PGF domain-containing protein [Candidatus Aenigmarchaeota archaeon]